jgi:hypothetical protein
VPEGKLEKTEQDVSKKDPFSLKIICNLIIKECVYVYKFQMYVHVAELCKHMKAIISLKVVVQMHQK